MLFGDMAESQQEAQDQKAKELEAKLEQSVAQAELTKQRNNTAKKLGVSPEVVVAETNKVVKGDVNSPMNPAKNENLVPENNFLNDNENEYVKKQIEGVGQDNVNQANNIQQKDDVLGSETKAVAQNIVQNQAEVKNLPSNVAQNQPQVNANQNLVEEGNQDNQVIQNVDQNQPQANRFMVIKRRQKDRRNKG